MSEDLKKIEERMLALIAERERKVTGNAEIESNEKLADEMPRTANDVVKLARALTDAMVVLKSAGSHAPHLWNAGLHCERTLKEVAGEPAHQG